MTTPTTQALTSALTFHDVSTHGCPGEFHDVGVERRGAAEDGSDSAAEELVNLLEGELIPHGVVAEYPPGDLLFLLAKRQVEHKLFYGRFFGARLEVGRRGELLIAGGRGNNRRKR